VYSINPGRRTFCYPVQLNSTKTEGSFHMRFNFLLTLLLLGLAGNLCAQPAYTLDLAQVFDGDPRLFRLLGSVGEGAWGVPVAGGFDMDGDSKAEFAMAAFTASPSGRTSAGQVFLVFGDGTTSGKIDTLNTHSRVLRIYGDQVSEHAGSELWMADVTGDDLGDLIICRQDYSPAGRIGAGALTLIPGQAQLRTMATAGDVLDLQSPPPGLQVITILGAEGRTTSGSRLCIWARTGDVTGDGIDDIVAGADRETSNGDSDSGAAYVFRGGAYLATSQIIDLANFGTVIPGNVARIRPPDNPTSVGGGFHFGATVQIGDLDDNGTAEVLVAAALNRAGAGLAPADGSGEGSGGAPGGGTLYIAWDDNFSGNWIPSANASLDFIIDAGPGSHSSINGYSGKNDVFGEEMLGGLDYDNDGNADLFAGDLTASGWGAVSRTAAGTGHVFYDAAILKGQDFDLKDGPFPFGFKMATFIGPTSGAIGGDTAMHGDFNGDGIDDLAFSSPHDDRFGRTNAGTMHILLGRTGGWPTESDLASGNFPDSADITVLELYGANGQGVPGDAGDTLSYSGAYGDMNGDGATDIITNEMVGNGSTPGADGYDVGNLLLLDIKRILYNDVVFKNGFESP
jgi:hypothetical protein